ncbi:uncharacterized protein LOC132759343 isoform X1 [Ruditapes philippinarum]|uniref:uncharacterized protein LOC132759343 isoform X1 n=1 Tax=Ruditapes philippinarum TaxID=129788 RepID=UPI00295B443A|nr:uncharacterized protein LOC132759343 isoform X1 [Ruditapes philippinarum]
MKQNFTIAFDKFSHIYVVIQHKFIMYMLLIQVLFMGVSANVVQMNVECNVELEVFIDCTNLQNNNDNYGFMHYNTIIQRVEINRLNGIIDLTNLPGVNTVHVSLGVANCKQLIGHVHPVELQFGSEPALTCVPNTGDDSTSSTSSHQTSIPSTKITSLRQTMKDGSSKIPTETTSLEQTTQSDEWIGSSMIPTETTSLEQTTESDEWIGTSRIINFTILSSNYTVVYITSTALYDFSTISLSKLQTSVKLSWQLIIVIVLSIIVILGCVLSFILYKNYLCIKKHQNTDKKSKIYFQMQEITSV